MECKQCMRTWNACRGLILLHSARKSPCWQDVENVSIFLQDCATPRGCNEMRPLWGGAIL